MAEEMDPALREQILQLIRDELTIESREDSCYSGGLGGGAMYRPIHIIELRIGREVFASCTVS